MLISVKSRRTTASITMRLEPYCGKGFPAFPEPFVVERIATARAASELRIDRADSR
jgi:hypothetical protein